MRAHYNKKSATELYNELDQLTQNRQETPADLLMRFLELRQKVIYASKESTEEMKYSNDLIQTMFIRTVINGLSNTTIPYLEQKHIEDEKRIESMNKDSST